MIDSQRGEFAALITNVYAFYRQDCSPFAVGVWWQAMKPFELAAITDAMNRHAVNPDAGQFLPKPADVVRMLQGGTHDAALIAWAMVDRAVRQVGTYRSVVFDDPLIHRVVTEMGGWIRIGSHDDEAWPFIRNEFVTRYRGYRMRNEVPEYPPRLVGTVEAQNSLHGYGAQAPVLIGDSVAAIRVMAGGTTKPLLTVTAPSMDQLVALVAPGRAAA